MGRRAAGAPGYSTAASTAESCSSRYSRAHVAFVVRQRGDRLIQTADGRVMSVQEFVGHQACPRPRHWPKAGVAIAREVWLPEVGPDPFLLVIGWRVPGSERP